MRQTRRVDQDFWVVRLGARGQEFASPGRRARNLPRIPKTVSIGATQNSSTAGACKAMRTRCQPSSMRRMGRAAIR